MSRPVARNGDFSLCFKGRSQRRKPLAELVTPPLQSLSRLRAHSSTISTPVGHKRARARAQKFLRNIKRRPCGHGSGLPMGRPASDAEQHQHHTRSSTWGNQHRSRRLAPPSWHWGGPRRPGLPARTPAAVLGHPGRPGGDVLPPHAQGRRKTWKGLRERRNPPHGDAHGFSLARHPLATIGSRPTRPRAGVSTPRAHRLETRGTTRRQPRPLASWRACRLEGGRVAWGLPGCPLSGLSGGAALDELQP